MRDKPCVFVFDTNVLLADPSAIFRFMEHDVFIPMTVLEELDATKKGVSDIARSAREVSRRLDELIRSDPDSIHDGIPIHRDGADSQTTKITGRLLLQTYAAPAEALPVALPGNSQDNQILSSIIELKNRAEGRDVVLLTKDINLRIKAQVLGIDAEDYYDDKSVEDIDLLYTGEREIDPNLIINGERVEKTKIEAAPLEPNECVYVPSEAIEEYIVQANETSHVRLRPATDYRQEASAVWGIRARNREQNFALNLLMDPEIDFVSLLGAAGTGKTLLALAAGLQQTLDSQVYQEIIVTRETISLGEDIGFLPGTEEEKMTPWMGALVDNLEVLNENPDSDDWGRAATIDLLSNRIKIRSMGFMRGRTFNNRYVIVDESQNMTAKQMRAIISRAGPGTKLVCLGNIAQIDSPYLSESTSGLTYVVNKFRSWPHSGHITLRRGERSRLAEFAAEIL